MSPLKFETKAAAKGIVVCINSFQTNLETQNKQILVWSHVPLSSSTTSTSAFQTRCLLSEMAATTFVFAVNRHRFELPTVDPSTTLLEFLRSHTPFKSVKLGCGEGGGGA
ncbi:hypothetical protein ACLB2K_031670 [Fragaria x ananassa]